MFQFYFCQVFIIRLPLLEHHQCKRETLSSTCRSEYIFTPLIVFLTKIIFVCSYLIFFPHSLSALHYQAAADFAKAHLPEALRQQLLTYGRERERDREKDKEKDEKKERGGLSYPSILEQQILTLDREMLDKLSATYNEAGVFVCVC